MDPAPHKPRVSTFIRIQSVAIGVDVTHFMTPDWDRVLRLYVRWRAQVRKNGNFPMEIQAYLLTYAKELERCGKDGLVDRQRTADEWTSRYFQHFGMQHLEDVVTCSRELPDTPPMRVWCTYMLRDVKNAFGKTYRPAVFEKIVEASASAIEEGRAIAAAVTFDSEGKFQLGGPVGRVERLELSENLLGADVQLLDTPEGQLYAQRAPFGDVVLFPLFMELSDSDGVVTGGLFIGWGLILKDLIPAPAAS